MQIDRQDLLSSYFLLLFYFQMAKCLKAMNKTSTELHFWKKKSFRRPFSLPLAAAFSVLPFQCRFIPLLIWATCSGVICAYVWTLFNLLEQVCTVVYVLVLQIATKMMK